MNRWNVIALYAGIICLISMSCIIFHVVSTTQSLLKLSMPWYLEASLNNFVDNQYQDNEAYLNLRCPAFKKDTPCPLAGKSDEEITALREHATVDRRTKEIARVKEQSLKSIVDGITAVIISLVFFIIHWRILRRSLTSPTS